MRTAAALLAALALAVAAAPAEAKPTNVTKLSLGMAEWVWGKPPCGKVKVTVDDFSQSGWAAHTYVRDCTIAFDRTWLWLHAGQPHALRAICTVTVHEWGHLMGRDHSDGGIMRSPVPNDYGPCVWLASVVR